MRLKIKKGAAFILSAVMFQSLAQAVPTVMITAEAESYDWDDILKNEDSWFGSSEGTSLGDTILKYQLDDGGWRKAMEDTSKTGSWAKSTIDNESTYSQIRVLARVYNATGTEKYLTGCLDGIDLLLEGQYDNGGWPQVFNDAGTYHAHITYNDNAMIEVMELLTDVRDKSDEFGFVSDTYSASAKIAVDKGIQCILDTQIKINGVYTGWGQQHDEYTLEPAGARAYELPSVCTQESVGIVKYLKSIQNPNTEIINRINAAVTWMTNAQLNGIALEDYTNSDGEADRRVISDPDADPLWARFYYLTDGLTPMFVDRQSNAASNWDHIGAERRTGYSWYGKWPSALVNEGLIEVEKPVLNGTLIKELNVHDSTYGSLWEIDNQVNTGELVFADRTVTYVSIPEAVVGAEYILTACDSKYTTGTLAEFTAGADIDVYIAMDNRVTPLPEWLSTWTLTGLTAANDNSVVFDLYKKSFASGDKITLGENGQSQSCVNYTVFVTKKQAETTTTTTTTTSSTTTTTTTTTTTASETTTTTETTITTTATESSTILSTTTTNATTTTVTDKPAISGDLNADGDFSIADIVMFQKWLLKAGDITDRKAADINSDGSLNVFDMLLLKRQIIAKYTA